MSSRLSTSHKGRETDRRWKGERHSFVSRVPRELAEILKQSADEQGITYSDWIVAAIAAQAGYELPAGLIARPGSDNTVQEEISMKTAV